MAQVRSQTRDPSPIPRQMPSVPDTLHFLSSPSRNTRRTESFQVNDLSPYPGSPIRGIYQQQTFNHWQSSPPPPLTGLIYNSTTRKYDPLTGLLINPSTSTTTTNYNNNNENYGQSYIVSTPLNQVTQRERQLLPPPPTPPPSSSEDVYSFQQQQYERLKLNNNEVRAIYGFIF